MANMKPASLRAMEARLTTLTSRRFTACVRHSDIVTTARGIHISHRKGQDVAINESLAHFQRGPTRSPPAATPVLGDLPLSQVLRTYLITSISSSPTLLESSATLLRHMLNSKTPLLSIEKNPVLKWALWHTFYKQFCGGENATQVNQMCEELRAQGYAGVILEYAREVLKDAEGNEAEDVAAWRKGILDSVNVAASGDFVGLKWSGLGPAALKLMARQEPPTRLMEDAMHEVCTAAASRGVSLLPAAEEAWNLDGFFKWSMYLQRIYNVHGKSVVYSTYQAYLKQMPGHLAAHLDDAQKNNFTLGAKLVRGAYLATEQRELIWPTIEDTHAAYDQLASALIGRKYNDFLRPHASSHRWPSTNVVLATHNLASVNRACALRQTQADRGEDLTPLAFAQLQGMADEVSCTLIAAAKNHPGANTEREKVVKCTTWGPMDECLNYLLRRAAENKDAASRTIDTRRASQEEIGRRFKSVFGWA